MEQSYTSQLQTIKAIEQTMLSLKSRLNFYSKEEDRASLKIQKILDSSIPIIKTKILQTQQLNKVNHFNSSLLNSKAFRANDIKNSKLVQQAEIEKSKIELTNAKYHSSVHIREISKKNKQVIIDAKKELVEEKKKKTEQIKACRLETKKKIQDFHEEKYRELRKIKNMQLRDLDRKVHDKSYDLALISKEEAFEQQKYITNDKAANQLRKLVRVLQTMKPEKFQEIKNRLQLNENTVLSDELIENVLLEVERKSSITGNADNVRNSLKETKKKLNRFKSEESTLKTIGVYAKLKPPR